MLNPLKLTSAERVVLYRLLAKEAREHALTAQTINIRDSFLSIARGYEDLAASVEELAKHTE